jgi:hypothetical protein
MLNPGTQDMTIFLTIGLPALLFLIFHLWYGGRGKPLRPEEIEAFFQDFANRELDERNRQALHEIRQLLDNDDGEEFVMQNLIRYRSKALYPPGYDFGDSAVEADRRYGRAIVPHLLRYGNVPLFLARRTGSFIEPDAAERWQVVAMVRYRSRRDFLRFVKAISDHSIAMHKWAAIESTHVFPVHPIVSLFSVRLMLGLMLALAGLGLHTLLT